MSKRISNKRIKQIMFDLSCSNWGSVTPITNDIINGWFDYKDGDMFCGREGRPYISLTGSQLGRD